MSGLVKKTKGRQKIEMKEIEKEDHKLITFSKRKSGIYKKASELATLCGIEIAILVFSPAGNLFSFGHPSVQSVTNRFLNQSPPPYNNTHSLVEAHHKARVQELTLEFNEVVSQLAEEKEKGKKLKQLTEGNQTDKGWWEAPIEQLSLQELLDQYSKLEYFRDMLLSKINEKITGAGAGGGDGDEDGAISALLAPMDPTQQTYPFATDANEEVSYNFTPGPGFGHGLQ